LLSSCALIEDEPDATRLPLGAAVVVLPVGLEKKLDRAFFRFGIFAYLKAVSIRVLGIPRSTGSCHDPLRYFRASFPVLGQSKDR
jgi:hypothetical protein